MKHHLPAAQMKHHLPAAQMKYHLPGAGHPTQTREEIQYTKVNVVLL